MPLGSLPDLSQIAEDALSALIMLVCAMLALGWLKVVDGELRRSSHADAYEKRRRRRERALTWPE
jgi:hypothetical protein